MKLYLKSSLLATLVALTGLILARPAIAGKIAGYQYITFEDGEQPIPGNTVHFIPCTPVNRDCQELFKNIEAELRKTQLDLRQARLAVEKPVAAWNLFTQLDQQFLPLLQPKSGYGTVKTQKNGLFSFNCPTQNCLVYSFGSVRNSFGYWIEIAAGRKRMDLGPGNGWIENMPSKL